MVAVSSPIGIFDSGVGGLSVLREIRRITRMRDLIYFADQAHVPYGARSLDNVLELSINATELLLARGAETVVVACNTASGAALNELRRRYPRTPFVGMEPAVKPAAERSTTRKVAVIATETTFDGELFASLMHRFAAEVEVMMIPAPGLVTAVEEGSLDTPGTRAMLLDRLSPVLSSDVDTLVLGCTHYPFLRSAIEATVGDRIAIIDPAPAVARQVLRISPSMAGDASTEFLTSGPAERFIDQVQLLLGVVVTVERVL